MIDYLQVLPKWITSSIRKQFVDRVANIPVYFEEQIKTNNKETFYFECRIDGPFLTPIGTKDEFEAIVEVNILINLAFDEQDTLQMQKLNGVVASALNKSFCVYKYGTELYDTSAFFETLQLITDDNIDVSYFGQIDPTNKIYQTSVEAHYKMRFKNGTVRP